MLAIAMPAHAQLTPPLPVARLIARGGPSGASLDVRGRDWHQVCNIPCEMQVPIGPAQMHIGRLHQALALGSGEAYRVEVDAGWSETTRTLWFVGWTASFIGAVAGGAIIAARALLCRVYDCTDLLAIVPFTAAFAAFNVGFSVAAVTGTPGGGLRLRPFDPNAPASVRASIAASMVVIETSLAF